MARKKTPQRDEEGAKPRPVPSVGTSLKGLLAGVSLASARAPGGKASAAHAKPSAGHAKPSAGHAKPSAGHAKPSAGQAKAPEASAAGPPARDEASAPVLVARPSDHLKGNDRIAFYDAIAGVRSLDASGRPRPKRAVPITTTKAPVVTRELVDAPARKQLGELVGGAFEFDVALEADGSIEALRKDAAVEALGALRREQPRVDATLDLHGLREAAAEDRVARWIRQAHRSGARRVLVIHGKGLHSPDGVGVVRDAVFRVLRSSIATPLVLAFASAPPAMGGTGATLVELGPG